MPAHCGQHGTVFSLFISYISAAIITFSFFFPLPLPFKWYHLSLHLSESIHFIPLWSLSLLSHFGCHSGLQPVFCFWQIPPTSLFHPSYFSQSISRLPSESRLCSSRPGLSAAILSKGSWIRRAGLMADMCLEKEVCLFSVPHSSQWPCCLCKAPQYGEGPVCGQMDVVFSIRNGQVCFLSYH